MSREESTRTAVHQLLRGQQLGVLSTAGEKGPYASLVAFAITDDDRRLFFVTPRTTRKFANIKANARVALLVNNSINRPADFHAAVAATILGSARLLEADQRDRVRAIYLAKHPYLRQFATSPSCAMFAIDITGVTMVQKFQSVAELSVDHGLDTER